MNKEDYLYVLELIPEGSEYPVPMNELEYFTGLEERAVKRLIQQVRLAGHLVVSHPKGGYFIPDIQSKEDGRIMSRFMQAMKAQAFSRIMVHDAMYDAIEKLYLNQVSFND